LLILNTEEKTKLAALNSFCRLLSSNRRIICHWESDPTHTLTYYSPNSENGYQSINQQVLFIPTYALVFKLH